MPEHTSPPFDAAAHNRELSKQLALDAHRAAAERSKYVVEMAQLGLRSLVLVNGGALVGMLTFLGHNAEMAVRRQLWEGFGWLIAGLAFALAAIIAAYLAQQTFSRSEYHEAYRLILTSYGDVDRANLEEAKEDRSRDIGGWLQIAAILIAVCSFIGFAVGCYVALDALIEAVASPLF